MALRIDSLVTMSRIVMPRASISVSARADRRAMSSQIGCPDGESAECDNDIPRASATICAVAAVPRN